MVFKIVLHLPDFFHCKYGNFLCCRDCGSVQCNMAAISLTTAAKNGLCCRWRGETDSGTTQISHPCTVCMQPMNSYHSGFPMQPPTKTNNHCDGVACQHPRKFRTAESLGTTRSWRFSNHGDLTFGVGKGYSNSICWRLDLNSCFKRTGVSNMWTEKLFVRGISNSLMADSVAANSLLLRTVSINAYSS